MLSITLDLSTTIIQAFMVALSCNSIANKENKLSKSKFIMLTGMISAGVIVITYGFPVGQFSNLLMVAFLIMLPILFYRRSVIDAFLGFGIFYTLSLIVMYFLHTAYINYTVNLNLDIPQEIHLFIFLYIPYWAMLAIIFVFRKYIYNAVIYIKTIKRALIFVLIYDYLVILFDVLRVHIQFEKLDYLFKSSVYLMIFMIFIFIVFYFSRISNKAREVETLNSALKDKIDELKKLKHDYGSEISSLHALSRLGKYDRLQEVLDGIVRRYQNTSTSVIAEIDADPIIFSVLHEAVARGVDVITFDSVDYEELDIMDDELVKLVSNIIRNSVDALKDTERPMIKYKSYSGYNGGIITIDNNGPEIPRNIRKKIFEKGFSTNENKDGDRGFGLSIVNDIIKKCRGQVSVDSNSEWTQFKIEIPYKKFHL